MDQDEVRGTILRQILVVFAIPLVFAVIHTFVGLEMVITLFATLGLYDDGLIRWSGVAVALGYCLIYVYIYFRTSKNLLSHCIERLTRLIVRIIIISNEVNALQEDEATQKKETVITKNGERIARLVPYIQDFTGYLLAKEETLDYQGQKVSYEEFLRISEND